MKLRVVTVVLLSLNLGFLVYLARNPHGTSVTDPTVTLAPLSPAPTPSPPETREIVQTITNEFQWAQVESEDYREYIARLRSIGCPEETLRDIIISDLDKLFAPRLQVLYPYRTNLQYWQPEEEELLNDINRKKVLQQEREIEREKGAVLKELIGIDLTSRRLDLKGRKDYYERRLNFLDDDKRAQVKDLMQKFHDLDWEIREKVVEGEPLSTDDREELSRIRQEKEAALDATLSPEERRQLDLWMSDTAHAVRHDIYGMDATEQEFLTIYKLRREFDQAWPEDDLDPQDPNIQAQREAAQDEMEVRLLAELGQERFLEYKRGQDPEFHDLASLVSRHNLPREVAVSVYGFRTAYEDHRDAVLYSRNLNEQQKQQVLTGLLRETSNTIAGVLGDEAFRDFHRNAPWLR